MGENIIVGLGGIFLILGNIAIVSVFLSWIYFKFIRKKDYHLHYIYGRKIEDCIGGGYVIILIVGIIFIIFTYTFTFKPTKKQIPYKIYESPEMIRYKESMATDIKNYHYQLEKEKEQSRIMIQRWMENRGKVGQE